MTDTTTVTREIDRHAAGRPIIDVSIEVKWGDSGEAEELADDLADAMYGVLDD